MYRIVQNKMHEENAEDGVRRKEKKVRGTFFPPNRPTRHDHAEETLDLGFKGLLGINQKDSGFNLSLLILCGRWDLKIKRVLKVLKKGGFRHIVLSVTQFVTRTITFIK